MPQDDDFEPARRCMLRQYYSSVQNHVGYVIAVAVGSSAIIANYKNFYDLKLVPEFFVVILVMIGVALYFSQRILFWTAYANIALGITFYEAERWFNRHIDCLDEKNKNKKWFVPHSDYWRYAAPSTVKIAIACEFALANDASYTRRLQFISEMDVFQFVSTYVLVAVGLFLGLIVSLALFTSSLTDVDYYALVGTALGAFASAGLLFWKFSGDWKNRELKSLLS